MIISNKKNIVKTTLYFLQNVYECQEDVYGFNIIGNGSGNGKSFRRIETNGTDGT